MTGLLPADALAVFVWSSLWCAAHSLFVTHWWDRFLSRRFPRRGAYARLVYVAGSTVSLAVLMVWLRSLPAETLWDWPRWWQLPRWFGVAAALAFLGLGARAHDNGFFLGLRQIRDHRRGRAPSEPPFAGGGILGRVRHPWYTAALLLLLCGLPWTDVNLVWRGVFMAYTLIGCELEERKLLGELGATYRKYRRRVPRYLPHLPRARRAHRTRGDTGRPA